MAIDLRPGYDDFRVTTQVGERNDKRMGPVVIVRARDAEHAKEVAVQHGHDPNPYFPPEKVRQR